MLFYGEPVYSLLKELGITSPPRDTVVIRRFHGVHDLYSGRRVKARLYIPDYGVPKTEEYHVDTIDNDLDRFLRENKTVIEKHLSVTKTLLDNLGEPDLVIISFSGGKDSVVVLDIAIKHYGRNKVIPVYVDTGLEFPYTLDYINTIEEYYGVEVTRAYAGIDKAIKTHGLPTRDNRWCTRFKQEAFWRKTIEITKGYDNVIVLLGDRDAESRKRSHRPPVRRRDKFIEVTPIKQWSTLHVQTHILLNKIPLNTLYLHGFYRIGCYICPALRSWELYIMRNKLWSLLMGREWIKEFMMYKRCM